MKDESELVGFTVTGFSFTYQRTLQVKQFEPITPSATVNLEVQDASKIQSAIDYARGVTRNAVREELAHVLPQVMRTMDIEFVRKWLDSCTPEQLIEVGKVLIEKKVDGISMDSVGELEF